MASAQAPLRLRCSACKARGFAVWRSATPPGRRRAVDLEDLSQGFACHDDGRTAAHILCARCNKAPKEEPAEAIASH